MTAPFVPSPPGAWEPLRKIVRRAAGPLDRFLHIEAASGITLMLAALLACAAAALPAAAAPKTVCTVTINSTDERETFQRHLPPG